MVEGEGVMIPVNVSARPGERAVEEEAVQGPLLQDPPCHG